MIITSDLRAAIRAASKAQPTLTWGEQRKIQRKAIRAMLRSKPALGKRVKEYVKAIRDAEVLRIKSRKALSSLGLNCDATSICDAPAFTKAGGVAPKTGRWKEHEVLAELACAEPSKRYSILKKYGINWK